MRESFVCKVCKKKKEENNPRIITGSGLFEENFMSENHGTNHVTLGLFITVSERKNVQRSSLRIPSPVGGLR